MSATQARITKRVFSAVCCILNWQPSLKAMETSDNSILSGYPVLRGPVSLIVNTKVRVGNSLQICRKLLSNDLFCTL